MTRLDDLNTAYHILDEAAGDVVEFGWANKPTAWSLDPEESTPMCAYQTVARRHAWERGDGGFRQGNDPVSKEYDNAILKAADVTTMDALFALNDSQPVERGQQWAFGLLLDARDIVGQWAEEEEKATPTSKRYPVKHTPDTTKATGLFGRLRNWFGKR